MCYSSEYIWIWVWNSVRTILSFTSVWVNTTDVRRCIKTHTQFLRKLRETYVYVYAGIHICFHFVIILDLSANIYSHTNVKKQGKVAPSSTATSSPPTLQNPSPVARQRRITIDNQVAQPREESKPIVSCEGAIQSSWTWWRLPRLMERWIHRWVDWLLEFRIDWFDLAQHRFKRL